MADNKPTVSGVISVIVATGLLIIFIVAVVAALTKTLEPPLQADPAPKGRPLLMCVDTGQPAETTQEESAAGNSSRDKSRRGDKAGRASSKSSRQILRVKCASGEVEPIPQARGAYDPNERYIGLLAIVAPLITTIVAFFFGARAGAGEGRTEAAQARASKSELAARVMEKDKTLYDQLRDEGRI